MSDTTKMFKNDSSSYLNVSENLYEGNGYSNCPSAPYYKDVLRTPTYPILIAATKVIIEDYRILFLMQLLLDLITTIMIFRIGAYLATKTVGLFAAAFYSISIINVVMCSLVLAETSFIFLMVLSLFLILEKKHYLLSGLIFGIGILCKPIGLYLILSYLAYLNYKKVGFIKILIFFLPFFFLVMGWMLRNQNIAGSLTISSVSSYSLFAYNANMIISHQEGISESELREKRLQEVYANTEGKLGDFSGRYDYIRVFGDEGKKIIIENLGLYSYLHLKNSFNGLIPGVHYVLEIFGKTEGKRRTMDVLRKEGIVSATKYYFNGKWTGLLILSPWILSWLIMIIAATMEVARVVKKKEWEKILLLILPGLYFLFISGPSAEPRFGALLAPYFCLLAGMYCEFKLRRLL